MPIKFESYPLIFNRCQYQKNNWMRELSSGKNLLRVLRRIIRKKSDDIRNPNNFKKMEKICSIYNNYSSVIKWGQRKTRRSIKKNRIRRKNFFVRINKRSWALWRVCLLDWRIWGWRKFFWRVSFKHDWILRYCQSKNRKMERINFSFARSGIRWWFGN